MLSTLVIRKSGLKALSCVRLVSVTPQRHCAVVNRDADSEDRALYKDDYPSSANIPLTLDEKIMYWKKANDIFFGPERDLKNFPHPEYRVSNTTQYTMGFIPTTWFKAVYPQLGVTGCYTLFWGSVLFLISKEILVPDHGLVEFMAIVMLFNYVRLKYGDKMKSTVARLHAKQRKRMYEDPLNNAMMGYKEEVGTIKDEIARQDAVPVIFQAKQEQLELQLEAEYRQRLAQVHDTVKMRLEYQADMEHAQRSFEQTHMVNWIVNSVKKSITPQQEKDSIANCIRTLKNLSSTAAV